MKRIVLFVFLILLIVGVVIVDKKQQKNAGGVRKFVFWSIQLKPIYEKQMNNIISEFEKKYPKYKVIWVDIPIQEAQKRTLASILSSTPPDLINLNPEFSHVLAQKNALHFFKESEVLNFHKGLVDKLRYKNKVYGLPFYATSSVTVYNKEILTNCIGDVQIKTYDDLFKNSEKLYSCSDIAPFSASLNENDTLLKILNKYDVDDFSDSEKNETISLFNSFNQMYKKGYLPEDTLTINHREMVEKYMSNQALMVVMGSNFIKMVKENAPDIYSKSEISEQLVGSNKKYDVSLMNLVIPARAQNKEMAYIFAQMLTSEKNQLELAKLTNVLPSNIHALKNEYFKNCPNDIEQKSRCISAKQLDNLIVNKTEIKDKKALNENINRKFEEILLNINSDLETIKIGIDNLFPRLKLYIEQN